jgi:hypothetical protein
MPRRFKRYTARFEHSFLQPIQVSILLVGCGYTDRLSDKG